MSAINDRTRRDPDVAAEPEYVERYLPELAGALVTFSATAGVDLVERGHDDPLTRAVTDLLLDAFQRGLRQGRSERPGTVAGVLQVLLRRATPAQAGVLLDLLEGGATPGA